MTQELLTKLAIRDVVERYFQALDGEDGDLLATCFADDAKVIYHTGTPGEFGQNDGSSAVEYLVSNMKNYRLRNHGALNIRVTLLAPDRAKSLTNAIAVLWKKDRLHFRGLRYEDELRLANGEWRIVTRRHSPLWQFDADPVSPVVPAPALELARALGGTGQPAN